MGGAAGFFLELICMLFIVFKYKLNMTMRLGLFILFTQHKSNARSYPRLHRATVNREDPSQQSVLLVTKATTIAYKTQNVS